MIFAIDYEVAQEIKFNFFPSLIFLHSEHHARSMRKLRRFVYQETKNIHDVPDVSNIIQKVYFSNLSQSLKLNHSNDTFVLGNIEKSDVTPMPFEDAIRTKTPIDTPKTVASEIVPGFLKDDNLRIVYEALKVDFKNKSKKYSFR